MTAFTTEQRAAIADRDGSALLAAAAGSGKTAVMVERFVEAALRDDVPVNAILALTFTEKAAGELRERVRRRLTELGEAERAAAVDGAWIGTIHGFCARVLRTRPLAAGLDPRFEVLDEPAARRLRDDAYERALEAWARARGAAAIDVAAAYGPGLRDMVADAYTALRSRGERDPRLPAPPAAAPPDPSGLAAARDAAARALADAGEGPRIAAARAALDACARVLANVGAARGAEGAAVPAADAPRVPWPAELDAAKLGAGARALDHDDCAGYRAAWEAYRRACADHHARPVVALLDDLLERFGAAYAEAKARRAGVDFDDLQLGVRDLFADEATRRRWAERFALIMVDEFQDTNRLQLDVLEALERDNLFAVGDELQSIYRFRHADVTIFRERGAALGGGRTRRLTASFRAPAELLDVLNGAFAPVFDGGFAPLRAGDRPPAGADLRLFDPDPPQGGPPVELLVTDRRGWEDVDPGLAALEPSAARRAEARLVAHRLRAELDAGRRPGDVVVLVRAAASLRLLEQALEEQGLPTYVVGGRGYWSQEQVRDGLAYLATLANPRDEAALYGVLASPFCGASADALVLLAEAGRAGGDGPWAALRAGGAWLEPLAGDERERLTRFAALAERERVLAERLPIEALLERAIVATGYDLAVLARAGGERRLANLRKLMRLAREYEATEGRDLRGFVAFAATQDLAQAREGEAALESEGLDAVRLMTIHRAKGLEFPVVCVADLGRQAGGARSRLLTGRDGRVGLRLAPVGGGDAVPALAYEELAAEEDAAEAQEERRLLYVAMTRARELLVLSGATDAGRWPEPRAGGPPIDWIVRALTPEPAAAFAAERPDRVLERSWDGRPARLRCALNAPATLDVVLPRVALAPAPARTAAHPGTALAAPPQLAPEPLAHPRPAPQRLSYTALGQYARCGYRFYLQRVLGLAPVARPPDAAPDGDARDAGMPALAATTRGSIVHRLLEDLDFARPQTPGRDAAIAVAGEFGAELAAEDVADALALVEGFAASPLRARLARAPRTRREAPFAFALDPAGGGPLVTGFLDVLAEERDGGVLIVDYKSDRLDGAEPQELVERDYAAQRTVYALAALHGGAPAVEVAYCFLERPDDPVSARFTPADAPALAERLLGLARGILEERYPVTDTPHRELCADCPGRPALCSHPEELTLRHASAGSLAGSGGPS